MTDLVFWRIIEQSKEESKSYSEQIEFLIEKIASLEENEIIEFEYRFREILLKLNCYNIMAATKIILGYVSDDSFLYFKCRLIAEGQELVFKSIQNPDVIAEIDITELVSGGENMLYVTDIAFLKKFGKETDKELPRDVAIDYLNYDKWQEIKGDDWKEKDLPIKYPKLWKKYKKTVT